MKNKKEDSIVEILVPSAKVGVELVGIPSWTLNYSFQSRKKGFQAGAMIDLIRNPQGNVNAQRLREKLFDRFRPANNSLNGYTPAGVTSRFSTDQ